MPNYPSPGVYVEEAGPSGRAIAGVATSTAAFIGPTRSGPVGLASPPLYSLAEFEHRYGGPQALALSDVRDPAYRLHFMAHAVRAYFANGGNCLVVLRTARNAAAAAGVLLAARTQAGRATLRARHVGAAGNGPVRLRVVGVPVRAIDLSAAPVGSLISMDRDGVETVYAGSGAVWLDATGQSLALSDLGATAQLLTLELQASAADGSAVQWSRLGFAPEHPRWLGRVLAPQSDAAPLWADIGAQVSAYALLAAVRALPILAAAPGDGLAWRRLLLQRGRDGLAPIAGIASSRGSYAAALAALQAVPDVSTVATPGSSAYPDRAAIQAALLAHVEQPQRWQLAVLDSAPQLSLGGVQQQRAGIDSRHAALYYPWLVVADPLAPAAAPREISVPPCGHVAGLYARSDATQGVHKAATNLAVAGALRCEYDIDQTEQDLLNPLGVNCLRSFAGRGLRVWGARLASSDPEWKYVPIRRLLDYLQASIVRGTAWAVFEPNAEPLWARVRQLVSDFLLQTWRDGALLGSRPEEAFFVRCDRTTMTQAELDAGQLVCLVGVAVLQPAEFMLFRIGQATLK
ncbi:phage tail sheath protein FI [Rhodoferax ferrireducens]|uniref:Phage tail sheath protein FI n=1 Tax=Rhodoferax ferrireducens TaxID=192843 RepID=A0ABU2C755_9BURK|nr:phage tail sheath subtilisin-like domain-containing protein [Rhodoferax ferrireducens]MDR7377172.1 phage tail sheath protein FI [Rhodoferax ferrireducens]